MKCMDCKNEMNFTRITSEAMVLTYKNGEFIGEEEMETGGTSVSLFCGECGSGNVQEPPKPRQVLSFRAKEAANG